MPRLAMLDSLQLRGYRFYWFSALLVAAARAMQGVVLGWLVLERTNSAFLVTLAGALNFLPMLGLGLFSGIIADRLNRRKLLIGAQIVSAASWALLGVLIATNVVQTWQIMMISLVVGTAWAIDWPCRQLIIADLAGEQNILNGIALDQWAFNLMGVIGSIVAGVIITTVGMGNAFYIVAGFFAFAAVSLFAIGRTRQTRIGSNHKVAANISEGIKYVLSNRVILGVLLVMMVAHLTLFPFRSLLAVFARDVLHKGAEGFGLLSAGPGVGAITGGLVMASLRKSRLSIKTLTIGAVAMALLGGVFALSRTYILSVFLLAACGFATSIYGALQNSMPLRMAEPQMRGRIMGLLSLVVGLMPLGMIAFGEMTDRVGAPAVTIAGSIIGAVLITGIFLFVPGLRQHAKSPQPQPSPSLPRP